MRSERGQIIVIFALALVAMIAMVGLILDGGAAFAHRRDEQTASDLAALAGANAFLVNYDQPLTREGVAVGAARESARLNGYEHGVGGISVDVSIDTTAGARVKVDIDAPHVQEFNKWYNEEHLPELLSVPGILSAARYEAVKGAVRAMRVAEHGIAGDASPDLSDALTGVQ